MKPIVLVILAGALLMMMISCGKKNNEDVTTEINKNGAVESSITVQHLDSLHDVLVTKHKVWTNNTTSKEVEYRDTIPALGTEIKTAENEDGDKKEVVVKKDYVIFFTVK